MALCFWSEKEEAMLRKVSFVFALLGALALPSAMLAGPGGGHGGGGMGGGHGGDGMGGGGHGGGGWGHGGGHGGWDHGGWRHGGHWGHGGQGRFWRGRWYPYGVGSCWRVAPGGWVWIC